MQGISLWKKLNIKWDAFQNSSIGKFILDKIFFRSKSFYSVLSFYGSVLVIQVISYSHVTQWGIKVEEQLQKTEGWNYVGWFFLSFFTPKGNILPIIILIGIILVASVIRYRETSVSSLGEKMDENHQELVIRFDDIEKLIKLQGGDKKEFLKMYFGNDYEKVLENPQTYTNLKLKLSDTSKNLDELLREKEILLEKIHAQRLSTEIQNNIEKAVKELRFKDVRALLDSFLSHTKATVEDTYKAHYQKALTYKEEIRYDKAKEEMEFIPSAKIKDAIMLNDYAQIYELKGEYEKALPLYEKALNIHKKVLGEKHTYTATSYNNLAGLYKSMGKYEKALPLYQKALNIREKFLGEDHPDTAGSYNNLAGFYMSMREYEKALPLLHKALKISEKFLSEDHPDTAVSYNNLAELYESMGKYEKALPLHQKALNIYEKILGKEHPSTAGSYNNLAIFYHNTKNFKEAYRYMQKAVDVWNKVLPENHPKLVESKKNLKVIKSKLQT